MTPALEQYVARIERERDALTARVAELEAALRRMVLWHSADDAAISAEYEAFRVAGKHAKAHFIAAEILEYARAALAKGS